MHHREAADERITKDPNLAQLVSIKGRLDKLTVPGVNLFGIQDVLIPVENGFMQEDVGFGNIQFLYPDECGHQGQTDTPELHNEVFAEFFKNGKLSADLEKRAGVSTRTKTAAG